MTIVAIENPTYQKAMRVITDITQAPEAEVTTSFAHNYVTGQIIRLVIPPYFGMSQLNEVLTPITVTSTTTFTVPIDTTNFDAFTIPLRGDGVQLQYAQVVPVGERTSQLNASTRNVLPYP